jgi:hemoglobin-like flavoprotein
MPDDTHHRKLMDGLKAVLNFRPGGEPSAIDSVAGAHRGFGLTADQLADFEASFLATLERRLEATGEDDAARAEIVDAWRTLFAPVRAELLEIATRC